MDIGGGNGYTSNYLRTNGYKVAVLEPTYAACVHARQRGIERAICGTIQEYDSVETQYTLLDVLEHIKDDETFLKDIAKKMEWGRLSEN